MFCWHKWGKWSDLSTATYTSGRKVAVQTRVCEKCNKMQVKPVEEK